MIKDNIASSGWGSHQYLSHKVIVSDKYCNNDCVHFRISYEDTKSLLLSDQIAPAMLKMDNFAEFNRTNEPWYSMPFFTFERGYEMTLNPYVGGYGDGEGNNVSVFLCLMKGPYDAELEQSGHWPMNGTFTIELLNQFSDSGHYIRTVMVNSYTCSECTDRVMWISTARKCSQLSLYLIKLFTTKKPFVSYK